MASSTEDAYLEALIGTGEADDDAYLQSLMAAPAAPAAPAGPALPTLGAPGFVAGAAKGAADVGFTVANVLDPVAQALENRFGTLGGPSVAEARAARDTENKLYEAEYGDSTPAFLGRLTSSAAATMFPIARGGAAVEAGMPRLAEFLDTMRKGNLLERGTANALTGAAQGGTAAAAVSGGYEPGAGEQTALGTAAGALLGPLAPYVQKLGGFVTRRMFGVDNPLLDIPANAAQQLAQRGVVIENLPAGVQQSTAREVAAQIAAGTFDPDQIARKANLEALGLKPTTAIITREPVQWANERELAKSERGAALMQTYQANNQVLKDHLAKIAEGTGGAQATAHDAGDGAINAVRAKFAEMQGEVSMLYDDIRAAKGDKYGLSPNRILKVLDEASDDANSSSIVDSTRARMRRLGVIDKDNQVIAAGPNSERVLTVRQAEELRKWIGGLKGDDRTKRMVIEALDDDVFESTGEDAFKVARDKARARFSEFESKILSDVVDGKAAPDSLFERYVMGKSATADDLARFRDSLTTGNTLQVQRGTQAWNDIRRQTAERILQKAANGNADEGMLSYPQLRKVIEQIGDKKLEVLFGVEGRQLYGRLLTALRDTSFTPGLAPINTSNTSNALMRTLEAATEVPLLGHALSPVVGAAQLGQKAMTQAAEKRAIENALLGVTSQPAEMFTYNPLVGRVLVPGAVRSLTPPLLASPQPEVQP